MFGTLKVTPCTVPITITACDRTEIYSGEAVNQTAFTYTAGVPAAGDTLSAVTEGSRTDVGKSVNRIVSYTVTNTNGDDVTDCYTFADCVDGTITVTKKSVTITVSNALKQYGAEDPVFTGDVSGLCYDGDLGSITYVRTCPDEEIGVYPGVLTAEYTANSNYEVDIVNGSFEITLSDKLAVTGTDYNGIYDGSYHGAEASVNISSSGVNDESVTTITYSTDGGETWSPSAPQLKNAGTLTVLVRAENDNYLPAQNSYTISIDPAVLSIKTESASKTFDDQPLTASGTLSGLVAGETAGFEVTGVITEVGSAPNTYELIFAADDNEFTAIEDNYIIVEDIGTLTISADERPDTPDSPGSPAVPPNNNVPHYPGTPDNTDTPDEPEDPNAPGDPEDPNTPDDPEDPNAPDDPEDPNTPEEPEDPNAPEEPEDPNAPDEPEDPSAPGEPEDPSAPGGTHDPGSPVDTPKPDSDHDKPGDYTEPPTDDQDGDRNNEDIIGDYGNNPSDYGSGENENNPNTGKTIPSAGLLSAALVFLFGKRKKRSDDEE